ncbi:MAG: hypothetical protein KC620_08125, partial [Myxococcales bacterium]|nr:hypothetical protein [Myxococcales bacterium]
RPDQLFDPVGESPRITLADDDRPTYTTSRVRPEDCASPGGKLGFRPDQFTQMESIVPIDAETLQIDPAVTRLNAGQGATTLSIAVPEGVSTGQRMLQGGEMRFHIDPTFMMASPCDRAEYDGWAGTLDVLTFDADETGVQTMRLFYSLTCAGTGGRTAQATGCLHYQAPME